MFGGKKKDAADDPQTAIQRLRETEEMLNKKSEFLEKKIAEELQTAKKHGTKNKRGKLKIGVRYQVNWRYASKDKPRWESPRTPIW